MRYTPLPARPDRAVALSDVRVERALMARMRTSTLAHFRRLPLPVQILVALLVAPPLVGLYLAFWRICLQWAGVEFLR